jgi:hypothetical protein
VREGQARIGRTLAIIEGLIDCHVMDQEMFSKALGVLSTMRKSQDLIEEWHRRVSSKSSALSEIKNNRDKT